MTGDCTLIINPLSGGFSQRKVSCAESALRSVGLSPRIREVRSPEDAADCARLICREEQTPFIIVAAGDGTINGIVNGLTPGKATLAVVPFGTANVLSRELGIRTPDQAYERIAAGALRPFSVGLLDNGTVRRYFLLMAGIGVDGRVVRDVRPAEKRLLRKGAYLLSALRILLSWETGYIDVVADSRKISCHSVFVCNASKYGGSFIIAPKTEIFSPGFEVLCITRGERNTYLKIVLDVLAGRLPCGNRIRTFHAQELEISGTKPLQADGDYYFETPVRISSVRDFLKIVV
jgi:YegS/Rv2252/BmrU family lipid kinase